MLSAGINNSNQNHAGFANSNLFLTHSHRANTAVFASTINTVLLRRLLFILGRLRFNKNCPLYKFAGVGQSQFIFICARFVFCKLHQISSF